LNSENIALKLKEINNESAFNSRHQSIQPNRFWDKLNNYTYGQDMKLLLNPNSQFKNNNSFISYDQTSRKKKIHRNFSNNKSGSNDISSLDYLNEMKQTQLKKDLQVRLYNDEKKGHQKV